MSMALLALCLAAGFAVGRLIRMPAGAMKAVGWALTACLFALVFILGLKLGLDRNILKQLGTIGVGSLALAAATVAGSVFCVWAFLAVRSRVRGRRP